MKPNLGIAEKDRDGVENLLTGMLADEYVSYDDAQLSLECRRFPIQQSP